MSKQIEKIFSGILMEYSEVTLFNIRVPDVYMVHHLRNRATEKMKGPGENGLFRNVNIGLFSRNEILELKNKIFAKIISISICC